MIDRQREGRDLELRALEDRGEIASAIKRWEEKFGEGAVEFPWRGGIALWQERVGTWAHFSKSQPPKRSGHYWNPFGRIPGAFSRNMLVEINPPKEGISLNVQGVIARAADGARWVLHNGRLHPSSRRITEQEFDLVAGSARSSVRFSNANAKGYHLVANLESAPETVQEQIADFVIRCERVRHHYMEASEVAKEDARVALVESSSSPEKGGQYTRGAQGPKIVIKKHADVWQALVAVLDRESIPHSNGRVGKYGPDLRTVKEPSFLFEIKTELTTSDVQKAIGQLFFYEELLKRKYKKILVLPDRPNRETEEALRALGLNILTYSGSSNTVRFDAQVLSMLLGR